MTAFADADAGAGPVPGGGRGGGACPDAGKGSVRGAQGHPSRGGVARRTPPRAYDGSMGTENAAST